MIGEIYVDLSKEEAEEQLDALKDKLKEDLEKNQAEQV